MKTIAFYISELDIGGAEKQLALLLPDLKRSDPELDIHVICAIGRGPIAKQLEDEQISVHYLNINHRFNPLILVKLYQILKKIRPGTLVTLLPLADISGRIIGQILRLNVICSQRSSLINQSYLRLADKYTRWLVNHYIVQSQTAKQQLMRQFKLSKRKISVIPNAVALPKAKQSHNHPVQRIICVANLKPGKGHSLLLKALKQIITTYRIKCLLVGDGPLKSKIQRQIKDLKLTKQVKLLGTRSDIFHLLYTSDIFVLPTVGEGMSNALLEAMAIGLPIITSDIPVHREIIASNDNGLLFKNHSFADLAFQLDKLMVSSHLRQKIGLSARHLAEQKHSLVNITPLWTKLLNQQL